MGVVSKVVRACDSDIPFPVKRKSFGFYFCPALNLSIRNFSTIPYTALLHGTVDLAYFLQTFRRHFFQNAYFTKVLQINTENISHTHWPLYETARLCDHLTFKRLLDNKNATGSSRKRARTSLRWEARLVGCCVLKCEVVPVCTTKADQRSAGKAPLSLNLCTRSRWMVTLTPGAGFPRERAHGTH
jgi:hypothetical protein